MFQNARLKLTAWYLLIITCVSLIFSTIIYQLTDREIDRFARLQRFRIERRFQVGYFPHFEPDDLPPLSPSVDPQLINETRKRLLVNLAMVNGFIVVASGVLGYFLAGRTLAPIQEMVEDQNRFIGDASHEIRTPLSSLKTSLEVGLRDKKLPISSARQIFSDGLLDIARLQSLSDSLLKLARTEDKSTPLVLKPVSISLILRSSVSRLTAAASHKKIKISTRFNSPMSSLKVLGDQLALTDLFAIIIDNAVKYSPNSSLVDISVSRQDRHIQVAISDQGVGISPQDLPHIFKRFYRADTARTKNINEVGGYGLGLAIAQRIAIRHHGSISVCSQPEKGSRFTVSLPTYS